MGYSSFSGILGIDQSGCHILFVRHVLTLVVGVSCPVCTRYTRNRRTCVRHTQFPFRHPIFQSLSIQFTLLCHGSRLYFIQPFVSPRFPMRSYSFIHLRLPFSSGCERITREPMQIEYLLAFSSFLKIISFKY